jgi:hypothetical protein
MCCHYFAYYNVSYNALRLSLGSGLFHASTGVDATGAVDVASIPPFLLSIAYLILWTHATAMKYHWNFNNVFHFRPDPDYDRRPFGFLWFIPAFIVVVAQELLFWLYAVDTVEVPFETQMKIFTYSIVGLFLVGSLMVLYTSIRWMTSPLDPNVCLIHWKVHLLLLVLTWIAMAFIWEFIGNEKKEWEHFTRRHVIAGLAATSIVFYSRVVPHSVNMALKMPRRARGPSFMNII